MMSSSRTAIAGGGPQGRRRFRYIRRVLHLLSAMIVALEYQIVFAVRLHDVCSLEKSK